MYILKHQNANGANITATATATDIFSLINTAASTDVLRAGFDGRVNAVDISVEDGDVRMYIDGNTPTASLGLLLSAGNTYYFRGIPLAKMQLIRVTADVKCSVQLGISEIGESTSSSAHSVTLEVGTVEIGEVDVTKLGGVAIDLNAGAVGAGTQRVIIANDQTAIPVTTSATAPQTYGVDVAGADTYTTVVTAGAARTKMHVTLQGENDAIVSVDSGTTDGFYIAAGSSHVFDVAIANAATVQGKNASAGNNYAQLTISIW